ncbi:MAG TPA: PAS domain-containing protein [Solirubrobacteraceae bacterium]|nr:PAS domain-containing protein [Solirubrobacteraceae bacterium]
MAASGDSVRRRQSCVLVVGNVEPEVSPWLRAGRHAITAVRDVAEASRALDETPADLVIVDRAGALDAADVCRALREDARLEEAWLLAITVQAQGRMADAVLDAGADDYLHRPFTRAELLARARAGLRAAQQRADDALMRAMMENVPGAIYRSAWHADYALELISDEIERISGYPAANFLASRRRTLMSIIHPDDHEHVLNTVSQAHADGEPFSFEYRIMRADGEIRWVLDRGQLVSSAGGRVWCDGAIFDITERRAAEEALRRREIEQARTDELRASRARIVEAADNARRRIERDLHDGAQQRLVGLALEVRMARSRVEKEPASAGPFLDHVAQALAEASEELRELARGIHPALLTERGLAPAITALASRAPVPVEVVELPEERLPAATEATAYFTVAEALTNVAKYADATYASVRLARENGALEIEVRDDGKGGAAAAPGSGLSGLADRLGALDGSLEVESPPGAGTVVRAMLPL